MAIFRGEIYFVNLGQVTGREQAGTRPVAVLSVDQVNSLPLVVTVVLGTKGQNVARDYPTNVRVPSQDSGLPEETVFLGFQLRSLDHKRFPNQRAGMLSPQYLSKLESAVRYCLGL